VFQNLPNIHEVARRRPAPHASAAAAAIYNYSSHLKQVQASWRLLQVVSLVRRELRRVTRWLTCRTRAGGATTGSSSRGWKAAGVMVAAAAIMPRRGALMVSNLRWLSNMKTLLSSAAAVARSLHEGHATLVHCSHGWDRTPQVCALAEVMLDGHYRTMAGGCTAAAATTTTNAAVAAAAATGVTVTRRAGLRALVEKEWLMFGHKFHDRRPPFAPQHFQHQTRLLILSSQAVWQRQRPLPCVHAGQVP
jgi:hypothetical protein